MDLVRELKDVRFELSLRGYDCEAVDAFLAKLRGDITAVQEENESAVSRIRELEQAVQDGGGASSETEGTLRRTLVLAQRLADETEAEAKKDAAEMLQAATADAEQMRSAAEIESQSMKEEGKRELDNARDEAATIRETVAEEAARTRGEARSESEAILAEAERRGLERVATLEQAAQVEAATMREPIRQEVVELEGARARVMSDIAALESHLEQQRVRVRTAVEALRVGMSGSIEDLERVADDDELLATQEAPETSGTTASDVDVAPDIEIMDSVTKNAPLAPTVDDIEHGARAESTVDVDESVDAAPLDDDGDGEPAVDIVDAEVIEADVLDGDVLDGDVLEGDVLEGDVLEGDVLEGDVLDVDGETVADSVDDTHDDEAGFVEAVDATDLGPATEPIPIIEVTPTTDGDNQPDDAVGATAEETEGLAGAVWLEEADDTAEELEIDELDAEPNVLFGTELVEETEVESVETLVEGGDSGPELAGDLQVETDQDDVESDAEVSSTGVSFVERFAELLDAQPIGREQ